jgi:UDP-N-acetylglucosamine acyltransferase
VTAAGNDAKPYGINSAGLKRRGFSVDEITAIKRAYKSIYRKSLSFEDAKNELAAMQVECDKIQLLSDFLNQSTRGIIR